MIETAHIGKYKDVDVLLIFEKEHYHIAFEDVSNHHYWLTALNRADPNYSFDVSLKGGKTLKVDLKSFAPILKQINSLIDLVVT